MSQKFKTFRDIRQDLKERLEAAQFRCDKAKQDFHRAQIELREAEQEISTVQQLIQIEDSRWAGKQPEMEAIDDRFADMKLRDACLILLDEADEWTLMDLEVALSRGSFKFITKQPGREIHMALVGLQTLGKAKRLESGVWRKPDTGEI